MANRKKFTRDELVLCIYAARYGVSEIGGIDAIHSRQSRSRASIKMKIQNIVAMCDEEGINRDSSQNPLTGKPAGEKGRRTNWELVASYAAIPRNQHLQECHSILQKAVAWPDELPDSETYREGSKRQILVNAYERDPAARKKCIDYYGEDCVVCGFNFSDTYGPSVAGFIHVHHLMPLSEIGSSYAVDPVKHLRPVCPNCHAAIHLGGVTRTIDEVRRMIESKRKRREQ